MDESIEALEADSIEQGQVSAWLVSTDAEMRLHRTEATVAEAESALAFAEVVQAAANASWEDPIELNRVLEMTPAGSLGLNIIDVSDANAPVHIGLVPFVS